MGCAMSAAERAEWKVAVRRSRSIDGTIRDCEQQLRRQVRLLMLGAGESGKSTIVRQMRIMHSVGYSAAEFLEFKRVIFSNIITSLFAIIKAMDQLAISFENDARMGDARLLFVKAPSVEDGQWTPELSEAAKRLWTDAGLQLCVVRAHAYYLNDSAEYFLSDLDRLTADEYIPSEQDVLHMRLRTAGILEIEFHFRCLNFKLFDIGGQRSERKKWIHCFEDVTAIIFVAALSEYDQTLAEDHLTNRMVESMHLFESISNNSWFRDTAIILFLNKKDIFAKKIKKSPLTVCFPEYTGANNPDEASFFILDKFQALNRQVSEVYSHFTCATDSSNMQFVFDTVVDVIIRENLISCGLF